MCENTRKLLSLLMAIAILFSMTPVGAIARAEEHASVETVTPEVELPEEAPVDPTVPSSRPEGANCLSYILNEDEKSYSVSGCDDFITGALTIPATYNGLPVTAINDSAFSYCDDLTSVTIPDSVTYIDYSAFYYCSDLTEVTLGNGITEIGRNSFFGCSKLRAFWVAADHPTFSSDQFGVLYNKDKTVVICAPDVLGAYAIPSGVTGIAESAFDSCEGLTDITIPETVTEIGDYAFRYCSNLAGIQVAESNPSYSSDSYGVLFNKDKTELIVAPGTIKGSYAIADGVSGISSMAFAGCYELTGITIPASVAAMGDNLFYSCWQLTDVTIESGVTVIGDSMFVECDGLESIVIPNTVTEIGWSAFSGCEKLKSVTIFGGETVIRGSMFDSCEDLTISCYMGSKAAAYAAENDIPVTYISEVTAISISSLPNRLSYPVGGKLRLSGLEIKAVYADGNEMMVTEGYTIADYDFSTAGTKTITISMGDASASFEVVVDADLIIYPESDHPYEDRCDVTWTYKHPTPADRLLITFSHDTQTEEGCDYIYIMDAKGNQVGAYSGSWFAGTSVAVTGDSFTVRLVSDGSVTDFGFAIESVEAVQLLALELGENFVAVPEDQREGMCTFTPEKTGVYNFYSTGDEDTHVELFNENGDLLDYDDDGGKETNFMISAELTAGKTYSLRVTYLNDDQWGTIRVIAEESPLKSITFAPVSIQEGTCGNFYNYGTDGEYFCYDSINAAFTATFADGTVLEGTGSSFSYNGVEYEIRYSSNQDWENSWTVGNTYYMNASVAGVTAQIPVTITESPLVSITFTPVSVFEKTHGYIQEGWDEVNGKWEYYCYSPWTLLNRTSYTAIFADGTVLTGSDSSFSYEGVHYEFQYTTDQSYENQWTVGNTYVLRIGVMGRIVTVPVTIEILPLESITFTPVSVTEKTNGYTRREWFDEEDYQEYYYYEPDVLVRKSEFTATFSDGTVITGSDGGFNYKDQWYDFTYIVEQDYNHQWTVGNTYTITVNIMGQTAEVPVTIEASPLVSFTFTPISVTEGTWGDTNSYWDEETQSWKDYYSYHYGDLVMNESTYTATFSDGTVLTGTGGYFIYDGVEYYFSCSAEQGYANPWTAGNTYIVTVSVLGQTAEVPVTIEASPLVSLTFTPVSVTEGTWGDTNSYWDEETQSWKEYYWYYYGSLIDSKTTYTARFSDGTVLTGTGSGFYYEDVWYGFSAEADQNAENPWTVGNTYTVKVSVLGKTVEVPVTITPSPLVSLTFTPVSVMEGTRGNMNSYWDEENQIHQEYYWYNYDELVRESTYTASFSDGTVLTGTGSGFYYEDVWYGFSSEADQNAENPWTVGNTYTVKVSVLGKTVEVPVTITASPLVSITFTPVSVVEGTNGEMNSYWDEETQSNWKYYWYYYGDLARRSTYTATFADGTVLTGTGGSLSYADVLYNFSYSAEQNGDDPWTAGNTYTITANVLGKTAEILLTITPSPITDITIEPIIMMEYEDGSWHEYGDSQYFDYNWNGYLQFTATFEDGTVVSGNNGGMWYNGQWFNVRTSDNQSGENPWLAGNTYAVDVYIGGKSYEAYVSIYQQKESNGYAYVLQDGKAIINDCTLTDKILQIPETLDGYPVAGITSLGDAMDYVEELYIPDSVTMLSADFLSPGTWYAPNIPLKKLSLGSGVSTLHEEALRYAEYLECIEVSAENPYLENVDGVVYDEDVTTIVAYPPAKTALHIIPDSVTDVSVILESDSAKQGLYGRTNIRLGAGVTDYKVVDGIIYDKNMQTVIRSTADAVGNYVMPDSVTDMHAFAFAGGKLTGITLGAGVTEITYAAFYGAASLEEITIPKTVRFINFDAGFDSCVNLNKVHITDLDAWCGTYFGDNPLRVARDLYLNGEKITDLVIPETVAESVYSRNQIFSRAFIGGSFETVTIPARITGIGASAFENCTNLKQVFINDLTAWSQIYFGNAQANPLFYARNLYLNGEKITDLVLPEPVTNIVYSGYTGVNAYTYYNIDIDTLTVPSYIQAIDYSAFANSSVEKITFHNGIERIADNAFESTAVQNVVLPKSLSYIGAEAFAYSALEDVTFNCEQVEIGMAAFRGCPLGDLELGDNVTYVGEYAFSHTNATQIKLPAAVTYVSYRTYAFNENLVSVTIPDTVSSVWFDGCDNLSHILYTGTQEQWDANYYSDMPEYYGAVLHVDAIGNEVTTSQNCTTITYYCSICDKTETIEKIDGAHSFNADGICTVCGYGSGGETECNHIKTVPIPGKAPTCTETGLSDGVMCGLCGEILKEQEVLDTVDHEWIIVEGKEPTCTETGLTEGEICANCGEVSIEQEAIDTVDHEWIIVEGKAPTCTETGLTEGEICANCGEVSIEQEEIDTVDHEWIIVEGKDPTCTEPGLTEGEVCANCGEISVEQEELELQEHEWIYIEGKDPTCTETGLTEGEKCAACGEISIEQEEIEALGHTPAEAVKENETASSYELVVYCEACGAELNRETVTTACSHTYTNDYDAVCDNCYFIRQMVDKYDFVNYRVVFSDSDTTHKNHRVIVYKLGDQTVADPSDEKTLKVIDPDAVTYWGENDINKILLTDAGNYVVLLKFNVGTATVNVPMVLSISDAPKLLIDNNNKMTILDEDATHSNPRAVVYYLGEQTVEDIYDVNALKAIDAAPQTVWQKSVINKLALTKGGTYVLHYQYNIGTSAAYTVAQSFTVEAIPTLNIDRNNMFSASDENVGNKNHRVVIYTMGENVVEDIFNESAVKNAAISSRTVWGLSEINKIEITEAGNYIVHLVYNVASGTKRILALEAKLYERPVLTVTEENKLNASYVDAAVITNPRATYYYFGENSVDGLDIYDAAALKAAATKVSSTIWTQNTINKTVLTDRGNYVIHLDYNENVGSVGSVKKTVAIATTIYDATKPVLTVEGNKLVATNANVDATNLRAMIYELGEETVENIYDETALKAIDATPATKWGLSDINKTTLSASGNYVVLLKYNIGTATRVVALQITI